MMYTKRYLYRVVGAFVFGLLLMVMSIAINVIFDFPEDDLITLLLSLSGGGLAVWAYLQD